MRPIDDPATRWNLRHPPATAVRVTLADGRRVADRTASYAIPWGSVALVRLEQRSGMWVTEALQVEECGQPDAPLRAPMRADDPEPAACRR